MFNKWIKRIIAGAGFLSACIFLTGQAERGIQLPEGRMPSTIHITNGQLFGEYDEWTSGLAHFWRTTLMDGFQFEYRWIDYQGQSRSYGHYISFQTCDSAQIQFGMSPETRKQYYIQEIGRSLETNPDLKEISDLIQKKTPVHLKNHSLINEQKYHQFLDIIQHLEDKYVARQGFYYKTKDLIQVDYANVIETHMPTMQKTALSFAQIAGSCNWTLGNLIEYVMSFTQIMEYMMPPIKQNERLLYGFWAPMESLINGRGDCDTKAALFASIVAHYKNIQPAVITIPGHAFNGLVGWHKRLPQDTVIEYQGQDILLLDLTSTSNFLTRGAINEYDKQHIRNRFPTIFIPEI